MLEDLITARLEDCSVPGPAPSVLSALLLLVDGRLPTGGHAHSGGIEAAVADGRVHDVVTLASFLEGKLATSGFVDAALAAAVVRARASLDELHAEAMARCPSRALRRASEAQGRGLLRVARRVWPSDELAYLATFRSGSGPLWPIVLGTVAHAAEIPSADAALACLQASISGPAWAAVRLLGLDPYEVVAILGQLASSVDECARRADAAAGESASVTTLPALGGPLLEIAAERHAQWEVRLFVS